MNENLKKSLNKLREITSDLYHEYVPIITDTTDIGTFGTPILTNPDVANDFIKALMNRIVYTSFEIRYFNNPLADLEGDNIPLGYAGQEIYINPAKGRKYNVNDFAGLLMKYESDVKVQYTSINMDLQYPVTITRHDLKKAFVSWEALDTFIDGLAQSLYNGAYIGEFNYTKELVSSAYKSNNAIIEVIDEPTTEANAKKFIEKARLLYLNFALPSNKYNMWAKVGGYGKPVNAWCNKEDIVMLIRNDILAYIDVNVLATSFNMDKSTLMGAIKPVDNFDIYDDDGIKIFDGSDIYAIICDKRFFRIKRQDMYLDMFYNANNRTWQYYLNLTKMYNYSLFANHTIFAKKAPSVLITGIDYAGTTSVTVRVGEDEGLDLNVTPITANTPNITYKASNNKFTATVDPSNDRHVTIHGVEAGTGKLTVTAGTLTLDVNVTVE